MSQDIIKEHVTTEEWVETKEEISQMLSKLGWKWAVMASTVCKIENPEENVPKNLISQIQTSRTQIESGCYSVCDITTSLREIEKELFSVLVDYNPKETNNLLDLTSKAMNGTITKEDVNLDGAEPAFSECLSLPCVCGET
ncbi:MAG: hypothetical protein ACXAD7_09175 [Candidatus Kariarchaeaceae archaeon]|jgi:hypothetical protein